MLAQKRCVALHVRWTDHFNVPQPHRPMKPTFFLVPPLVALLLCACDANVDFGERGERSDGAGGTVGSTDDTSNQSLGSARPIGGASAIGGTASVAPSCGDGNVTEPESCDDGNRLSSDGCDASCRVEPGWTCVSTLPPCGDGNVDGAYGICPTLCTQTSICGNGVIEPGEVCDFGSSNGLDNRCSASCRLATTCGDGVAEAGEVCDDGNIVSGDGCRATCDAIEYGWLCPIAGQPCVRSLCGNGVLEFSEICDEGALNGKPGHCSRKCSAPPICGDGIVESPPERCDLGAANGGSTCTSDCLLTSTSCGNGVVDGDDQCDFGTQYNIGDYGGCTPGCQLSGYCGDGVLDAETEECDMGAKNGTDVCAVICKWQ